MRTALLAASKLNHDGQLRAFMPFAGRSVIGWQTDLAHALGCERIICRCDSPGPEILALQHTVEANGGEFHAVRSNAQIVSLLRTDDELLILLDGLMFDRDLAEDVLLDNDRWPKTVLTWDSASPGAEEVAPDFERIDADRIWAGLIALRADAVHKLAELPTDGDANSLLLRLALQSGVRCTKLPASSLADNRVWLARSAEDLANRQRAAISSNIPPPDWSGPLRTVATFAAARVQDAGVAHGVTVCGAVGLALTMAGAALAWWGMGTTGLPVAAAGAFLGAIAIALHSLRNRLFGVEPDRDRSTVFEMLLDIIALAAVVGALSPEWSSIERAAIPIFAFGLTRIAAGDARLGLGAFWRDRSLHLVLFGFAAFAGALLEVVALLGLVVLGLKLLRLRPN